MLALPPQADRLLRQFTIVAVVCAVGRCYATLLAQDVAQRLPPSATYPGPVYTTTDPTVFTQPAPQGPSAGPIVTAEIYPIDLVTALRIAGVQNPTLGVAYQRTLASLAARQLAAANLLPNLNGGTNYDGHSGVLQQSSGNILNVNRDALYVGAGANAVAAGSVSVPGVQYNLNASETIYRLLASRPILEGTRFAWQATRNELQREVAIAYGNLLRAEGNRAIARQVRDEANEIARVTNAFAETGQGRASEAERAATEFGRRQSAVLQAEAQVIAASARLVELLNMRANVQLQSAEPWIVPRSIVPDPIPLPELLAIALYQRPELAEQRASINAAMLTLQGSRMLLFSPQIIMGYSAGAFGGGSNIISETTGAPRFGDFGARADFDAVMYWSLRNLGIGNRALVATARARLGQADMQRLVVLNRVQAEVAEAYARKRAQMAQLDIRQRAVESSQHALLEDLMRTRNNEGHPIEVLDSLRLLADARVAFLNAIVDYNQAHFDLYTEIGQPAADLLVRPRQDFGPPATPSENLPQAPPVAEPMTGAQP
ncbi:MAG TPA: TolC family protein [Pirellulales bacterium]|nr:TolC family protein [Pirellulales bacterium]